MLDSKWTWLGISRWRPGPNDRMTGRTVAALTVAQLWLPAAVGVLVGTQWLPVGVAVGVALLAGVWLQTLWYARIWNQRAERRLAGLPDVDPPPAADPLPPVAPPAWGPARTLLFRFVACYLGLTSLLLVSGPNILLQGVVLPVARPLDQWVATHVLGWEKPLDFGPNGSGDTPLEWARAVVRLGAAVLLTTVWTLVRGRRPRSAWPPVLLQMVLRYALAGMMVGYGLAKVIPPRQFPELFPGQLERTYGDSSPMGLLWTFMSASQPYTVFAGLAELTGGLLLLSRRTALLGAAVTCGVMLNVVMLNLCYDEPVKLHSGHYLLMAATLLSFHAGRLWNLFVLNRPVPAADLRLPPPGDRPVVRALVTIGKWVMVALTLLPSLFLYLRLGRPAQPEPPDDPAAFHGLYAVEWFERDGKSVPPRRGEAGRWTQVSVASGKKAWAFTADDVRTALTLEELAPGRYRVTPTEPVGPPVEWAVSQPALGTVEIAGGPLRMGLRKRNLGDYPLVNRGFRWISEAPYNR